ncbi:MAG: universal stress protein [Succinivibrio sp.]|nr:universal stress protein [Succinivibrio sp.]
MSESKKIKFAVLLKPGEAQPAIERVAQYARMSPDIGVVAIRVINEFTEQNKDNLAARTRAEFDALRRGVEAIRNLELKIIFDKDVPQSFIKECEEGDYDLAIISANRRSTLRDLFVSTIDSTIMRGLSKPLLVVKNTQVSATLGEVILMAVDFEESAHLSALDDYLLNSARRFAELCNGHIHVVNCVSPLNRGRMSGKTTPSRLLDSSGVDRVNIHERIVFDFARNHGIDFDSVHVVEGRMDEMIPRLCEKLDARMVCMGTSPKSSFFGAMDSSASEMVLEQIKGDLFIVNSEHLNDKS